MAISTIKLGRNLPRIRVQLFSNIISRETKLPIGYFEGTKVADVGAILYVAHCSWNLIKRKKTLKSEKDLDEIIKKCLYEVIETSLETESCDYIDCYKIRYCG